MYSNFRFHLQNWNSQILKIVLLVISYQRQRKGDNRASRRMVIIEVELAFYVNIYIYFSVCRISIRMKERCHEDSKLMSRTWMVVYYVCKHDVPGHLLYTSHPCSELAAWTVISVTRSAFHRSYLQTLKIHKSFYTKYTTRNVGIQRWRFNGLSCDCPPQLHWSTYRL